MATVKEISQDIQSTFGSAFINRSQAGQYLGMSKVKACEFLAPLPVYETGKNLMYHKTDIARRMDEVRTYRNFGG